MPIAGSFITLNPEEGMDKITQTEKVTTPYFSDGSTTLAAASIVSTSLSDTNEQYFFGISNSSTPTVQEFNVAFGSDRGFGNTKFSSDANAKFKSEAIYKQFANLLLAPTEVTGGFFISSNGSAGAISTGKDREIFILSATRTNMKDRINKGTWTIALSGSATAHAKTGAPLIELTDDSVNSKPTSTIAGDRYNIVSGAAGVVSGSGASYKTYGHFYPDQGILIFSQAELSASLPGSGSNKDDVVVFDDSRHKGFGIGTSTGVDKKTALRFVNCLQPTGAKLTFRDEEDQVSAQYFCRVRSGQMNFSNSPTFVSGSLNELRQKSMKGNPSTFITQIQLYNGNGDMVAVGNLSTPLIKSFTKEATIKVKLTY